MAIVFESHFDQTNGRELDELGFAQPAHVDHFELVTWAQIGPLCRLLGSSLGLGIHGVQYRERQQRKQKEYLPHHTNLAVASGRNVANRCVESNENASNFQVLKMRKNKGRSHGLALCESSKFLQKNSYSDFFSASRAAG
ncbi:hypothetical protein [Anatilimnocola floriformis]|uniref:hypothetical protein n=1 Tax=Anatilimnocola floriformis TaxID=2948575 RepID=UPI0020C42AED|nr:hypothetical protein [Anatilimnocola floriformis]